MSDKCKDLVNHGTFFCSPATLATTKGPAKVPATELGERLVGKLIIRAVLAACLLLTAGGARAATTWECYVYNPLAKQPSVDAVIRMIDEIKQKTNGDLLINLHL